VDIAGTGSGTVTSSPSGLATCTGAARTCVGGFETGTVVTLTATAANGREFTGWGGACQGTDTCTVMMADARYVAAHFRLIPALGTSFYHLDTLGSVRAVTNAAGDVIRRDDYHAFGEAGTPPVGDPIRFTGKERDAETALDYFGARYYRNLTGRFTTVDPLMGVETALADPQRWNRYSYVGNRPTRVVDPDGRGWLSTAVKIIIKGGDIAASVSGIIDDYKTITDANSSVGEKILAGLSLASEALPISAGDVKGVASFAMRHGDEAAKGAAALGFSRQQLQHAFKHPGDFGVSGNPTNRTLSEFQAAIQMHIDAPGTRVIQGTFHRNPATLYVGPRTRLAVIQDSSGNFLSGWKLSVEQLRHALTSGNLGGG